MRSHDHTRAHFRRRGIEFLRKNHAPVVDEKSMGMVTYNRLTELLLDPLGCRVGGRIAVQDRRDPCSRAMKTQKIRNVADTGTKNHTPKWHLHGFS